MSKLKELIDDYMRKVSGLGEHCDRCLRTERWGGSVLLMVVDAAFMSIGLNYFTSVVPKVLEFNEKFVENGRIKGLIDLEKANADELREVWRNERSWSVAKKIAAYLLKMSENDKVALRTWASSTSLEDWMEDPIGRIKGVGIITFQYLRMMGGIDTVMPDKIVKRVINGILEEANLKLVNDDLEFVKRTEDLALKNGYKPIELCWMTWLIQPEGRMIRMEKYRNILLKI
jgi:hypothetical protein